MCGIQPHTDVVIWWGGNRCHTERLLIPRLFLYSEMFWERSAIMSYNRHAICTSPRVTDVQYVTCRAQMCTEANRNYPFPGYIDISSLVVQDDYIFIQVALNTQCKFNSFYRHVICACVCFVTCTKLIFTTNTRTKQAVALEVGLKWNTNLNIALSWLTVGDCPLQVSLIATSNESSQYSFHLGLALVLLALHVTEEDEVVSRCSDLMWAFILYQRRASKSKVSSTRRFCTRKCVKIVMLCFSWESFNIHPHHCLLCHINQDLCDRKIWNGNVWIPSNTDAIYGLYFNFL